MIPLQIKHKPKAYILNLQFFFFNFQIFTMTLWTKFSVCIGSLHRSELLVNCCLMASKLSSPPLALHKVPQHGTNSIKQIVSCLLAIAPEDLSLNAVHSIMILPHSYQISSQGGLAYLRTMWKVTVTCYLFLKDWVMTKDFTNAKF